MKRIATSLFLILGAFVQAQDSVSVLFIGNSYTYVNDLPSILAQLSNSLGDEVFYASQTAGGATFETHAGNTATYTAINMNPWDFVVMQAQSQEPSFPDNQVDTQTLPYALQMSDSVYTNHFCSEVLMFMTWGRENGDPQWAPISTFEGMNNRLRSAYMRMADSVQGSVSPVGSAWAYVRETWPAIGLYAADGSHPSYAGSYLAACTFYAALFRQSPVGAPFIGSLDATTAGNLQAAAALTVLDSLDQWNLRPISEHTQSEFAWINNDPTINFVNESTKATTYLWDFGDAASAVDEHPVHTYSTNGTYAVSLIASSPCDVDTASYQVTISSVGVDEFDRNFAIANLGHGQYSIDTDHQIEFIELFDQTGRLMKRVERPQFDLSGLPYGLYLLQIHTTAGQSVGSLPYFAD